MIHLYRGKYPTHTLCGIKMVGLAVPYEELRFWYDKMTGQWCQDCVGDEVLTAMEVEKALGREY